MIFSQYKETCEVILYYPKNVGEDKKQFVKTSISDLMHANIDVRSRRLIAEFSRDSVKCIPKTHSYFANMNFSEKVVMIDFYSKLHIK